MVTSWALCVTRARGDNVIGAQAMMGALGLGSLRTPAQAQAWCSHWVPPCHLHHPVTARKQVSTQRWLVPLLLYGQQHDAQRRGGRGRGELEWSGEEWGGVGWCCLLVSSGKAPAWWWQTRFPLANAYPAPLHWLAARTAPWRRWVQGHPGHAMRPCHRVGLHMVPVDNTGGTPQATLH